MHAVKKGLLTTFFISIEHYPVTQINTNKCMNIIFYVVPELIEKKIKKPD